MTGIRLGLRYERLLIFAAPLLLTTLIVLFVAFASLNQKERREAVCFGFAVKALTENQVKLQTVWETSLPKNRFDYWHALWDTWTSFFFDVHTRLEMDCFDTIKGQLKGMLDIPPGNIIEKFQQEAALRNNMPFQLYNVEIPDKATISFFGTDIKIGLITLAQILQIALAPLLLLWLGSLYATRLRESLYVRSATTLSEVFPHSINIYATGRRPQLRKRNFVLYHFPKFVFLMYALFRIGSLSTFILPPIVCYLLSLTFLHSRDYSWPVVVPGVLVPFAAILNLVLELGPWHYQKLFSESDYHR